MISDDKYQKPNNAIILAAGFGMRMVPINTDVPKALLKVNDEVLIERIIRQLKSVHINNIYVVVGYMKDQFEYLKDQFGVTLIENEDYASKNNLYSLSLATNYINNSYIIPCDLWCEDNPFNKHENQSWYMITKKKSKISNVVENNGILNLVSVGCKGDHMIGISYISTEVAARIKRNISSFVNDVNHDQDYWESALVENDRFIISPRIVDSNKYFEINTYEDLRNIDINSEHLKNEAIELLADIFSVDINDIVKISVLKKGMTNKSFLFSCKGERYIMRIPGEGTDFLINRVEEAEVYNTIKGMNICDEIKYINPNNGYKITKYLNNVRNCDAFNIEDVKQCMSFLKKFHNLELTVDHEFNIYDKIDFYESLRKPNDSIYSDYNEIKLNVFSLQKYINKNIEKRVLTHIDAVADNFLFVSEENEKERIYLIDWEYAAMQDPHVDIAMFAIYSLYDKEHVDQLINLYFDNECPDNIRLKIYCYIAACGLLWSNWCEYKMTLGIEFGEYSLRQYQYAKDYYDIVKDKIDELGGE